MHRVVIVVAWSWNEDIRVVVVESSRIGGMLVMTPSPSNALLNEFILLFFPLRDL